MKPILLMALAMPLLAQTPASPAPPAPPAAESPVPAAGNMINGWVEVGYRSNTGIGGSLDTYRSVVNLGSGVKLMGADFTIAGPGRKFFDSLHVQAYDWSDPYSTLRADASKQGLYTFSASYRSLAYFNNLPSVADPLLTRGIVADEQSFDTRRHLASVDLHLLPRHWIAPYFAFDHDANGGHGVSAFQTNENEYAVPYASTDITNLYRGGVNVVLPRLHLTLEEGGTTYKSNQNSYASGTNFGNSSVPYFGQTLDLTGLVQTWGIRGASTYTRAILTASPLPWLDVYGHFGYVDPHNTVNYTQYNTGSFVLASQILFYSGEQFLETAAARMPHTSADIGWEIRPFERLRIQQSVLTDRQHNAGSSTGADVLLSPGVSATLAAAFRSFLASNYNQTETGVSFDATPGVTVRAAYRYVWGNAEDLLFPQPGLHVVTNSALRRNVILTSASWRVAPKLLVSGDFEKGMSGSEYFRTSLYNYRKARFTGRYNIFPTLRLSAEYSILSNRNPLAGSPYKFLSHQESLSAQWIPAKAKITFDGTYEHCGYHTEIEFLDSTYLSPALSNYREACHDVSATVSATLPAVLRRARLSAGGSAVLTSGSRPATYYQPVVRVSAPLTHNVGFFATWQYYGFGETYYMYENFHAGLFTAGLRISR